MLHAFGYSLCELTPAMRLDPPLQTANDLEDHQTLHSPPKVGVLLCSLEYQPENMYNCLHNL